ncbi:MFS transporter [Gordonia humi]|uniref:MFS transporter n=1 Tax=Gordonia humi TaxID=686429 RepID=UPI003606F4B9
MAEYSPDRRRGFLGSWLDFGTFVGYSLGSLTVTVLNGWLGEEAMIDWGWRIPFFIAGPMGLIGLYLRMKLEDTPAFRKQLDDHEAKMKQNESAGREIGTIFVRFWRPLLICIGLVLLYNVTNYMITAYLPTYFTDVIGRSQLSADLLVLASMVVVVLIIVGVGALSDKIGRRPVFAFGAVMQIIVAVPCFMLFRSEGIWAPAVACVVFGVVLACFAAPTASTLPALFPTSVRYGALSIGFNIAVSAFGGTTPLYTEAIVKATDNTLVPGFILMVSGVIGLVAVKYLKESAGLPLNGSPPQVDTTDEAAETYADAKEAALVG